MVLNISGKFLRKIQEALSSDWSAIWKFTTVKADQTITFSLGSDTVKTYGSPDFSLSATASSGLTVSFASSDPTVASISGSTVTIHKTGTTTITASQAGNSTYYP